MSMSSAITLAQLERAMMYVKAYHDENTAVSPLSGTVYINGDLNTDLAINGNLQVSGTITGNATATGYIFYKELTGTAKQGAKLSEYDISVENGGVFIYGSVSKENAVLYTTGNLVNNAELTLCSDLTIETEEAAALENHNAITIQKDCNISVTASMYALSMLGDSSLVLNGVLTATATSNGAYGIYVYNTAVNITINGTLNAIATASGGTGIYLYTITYDKSNPVELVINSGGCANIRAASYGIRCYYTDVIIMQNGEFNVLQTSSYAIDVNSESTWVVYGTVISQGSVGLAQEGVNNSVTIEVGGRVEVTGSSFGIYPYYGTLTVKGTLIAKGTGSNSYGCYLNISGHMTVEEGGVVEASGVYSGVYLYNAYTLTVNGTLNSMNIESSNARYGMYLYGSNHLIVNGTLNTTGVNDTDYGLYVYSSNEVQVNGIINCYAKDEERALYTRSSSFAFTGTGKLYANDILYYDGSEDENEPV